MALAAVAAAVVVVRAPKTNPTPSAVSATASALPSPQPENAPALSTPAAVPVTANTNTQAVPAATPPAVIGTSAPAGKAGNHPKTLTELYRTFDAINAAAETTTPESLATLIDFAATENSDVRTAALNAIINRDDASAAPLLRKAAKQLDDSKAIIALLQTADYIELPGTTMTALAALPKTAKVPKPGEHPPATAPTPPTASP